MSVQLLGLISEDHSSFLEEITVENMKALEYIGLT